MTSYRITVGVLFLAVIASMLTQEDFPHRVWFVIVSGVLLVAQVVVVEQLFMDDDRRRR